jgi:isopenicillin N synthase-like dioxygenase
MSGALFRTDFVERFVRTGFATADIPHACRDQTREVFRAGSSFFAAELPAKMTAQLPLDTGYRPYGIEFSQAAGRPDEMESFSVTRHLACRERILPPGLAENLRLEMLGFFDIIEPLVEALTIHVAKHVSTSTDTTEFSGSFRNWSLLQLNYSRPSTTTADYINELHEDGCLMTVMTVTGPGLELKESDDSFVPMQPTDSLLFMSGEILNLLSGGSIPAVYHRVRPVRGLAERMALLLFADLKPTLCKPWIVTSENSAIDIGRRVLTNSKRYGLAEWNDTPREA